MTPHAALERGLEELELALPASTRDQLIAYVMLLAKWNRSYNLTAVRDPLTMVSQHLLDSLAVLPHLALPPHAARLADVGTGAGLPGIPVALARPHWHVALIESNQKKAAFLREAIRRTNSPGVVHLADIGDSVDRIAGPIDYVTARAVAPLHQLIGFAEPFVRRGAKGLFLKGQDVEAELTEATKYWKIEPRLHSSRTGGHGWIVELDRIERRTPSATALGSRA